VIPKQLFTCQIHRDAANIVHPVDMELAYLLTIVQVFRRDASVDLLDASEQPKGQGRLTRTKLDNQGSSDDGVTCSAMDGRWAGRRASDRLSLLVALCCYATGVFFEKNPDIWCVDSAEIEASIVGRVLASLSCGQ